MNKLKTLESTYVYIEVFTDDSESILFAVPYGYVGPTLVKKDLKFLNDFDKKSKKEWKYLVDNSQAKIVNPANPILLRSLKNLTKMKEYMVYAPSPIVRTLLSLTNWINKPDRVLKTSEELQSELLSIN